MSTKILNAFDCCWHGISRCEGFICQYGHYEDADWQQRWSEDLELSYANVDSLLKPISKLQEYRVLTEIIDPFLAKNAHHALATLLQPPEQWFGRIWILETNEYLSLKQAAKDERSLVISPEFQLEQLTEAQRLVYEAVTPEPQLGKWIEKNVDVHPDNVRRYLAKLKRAGLIEGIPRNGYFRT